MRLATTISYRLAPAIALLLFGASTAAAQVSIGVLEAAIGEDFNTMASSGTRSTVPTVTLGKVKATYR